MEKICAFLKDVLFCEKIIEKARNESFLYISGRCLFKNVDKNIIFCEQCGCEKGKCAIFEEENVPSWAKDAIKNKNNYFPVDIEETSAIINKKRGRPRKED